MPPIELHMSSLFNTEGSSNSTFHAHASCCMFLGFFKWWQWVVGEVYYQDYWMEEKGVIGLHVMEEYACYNFQRVLKSLGSHILLGM